MTNEQAKHEAIKKAYGEHWDLVKDHVKEWGGLSYQDCTLIFGDVDFYFGDKALSRVWQNDFSGYYFPKEIFNISNNNGWIRIERDASNLPEKYPMVKYRVLKQDGLIIEAFSWDIRALFTQFKVITHYKPIEPELKPIY